MPSLDQILPSLESLGLWSYWLIGLAALLESFFLTGVIVPGALVVDAGGILVQRGALDFFDLVWFVAIGAALGGEFSFRIGRYTANRLKDRPGARFDPRNTATYRRASDLFERRGPVALVIGRFTGPVAGFVPFVAALSGMPYRRFALWNLIGAVPYALFHISIGYFLGDVLGRLGTMATRFAIVGAAIVAALALVWFIALRVRRGLPIARSILRSMGAAIATNPEVVDWSDRHPRTTRFLAGRFDQSRFAGLTATVLGCLLGYILILYAGSVQNFLQGGPFAEVDQRLATLIHTFWNPRLLAIAAHLTALGDWRTVTALALGISAILFSLHRRALILGLAVSVLGNTLSVSLLKRVFDRPRSDLSYFIETSGSFPSGHAAIAVAFYGFACFIGWRMRLIGPVVAVLVAVTIAFLVGFSRVYLIEHYLSDVLNGYIIGALWLTIGVAVAEWQGERAGLNQPQGRPAPVLKPLGLGAVALSVVVATWVVWTYDKPRPAPPPALITDTVVADLPALLTQNRIPRFTETIAGATQEPINLVIVAPDLASFTAVMAGAGWTVAQSPTLGGLTRAAYAAWMNQPDPDAPVTPYFWRDMPNDLAFQKPTPQDTLRQRHHVRFWVPGFTTPTGQVILFGSASFDDGLEWGIGVTHRIDPNIDAERDLLATDLAATGRIAAQVGIQAMPAQMGQNFNGDPWFTDGNVILLTLAP